jgi:thiosulfate/3-mercaptopyruvate sulfurtransferase
LANTESAAGPLIDVAALAQALAGPVAPVLLDVRWQLGGPAGVEDYAAGHIPGAVFVDLERDLSAPPGAGGRHPLPDAEAFAAAMRAKGVSSRTPVVAYDAGGALSAARAWWLLRYFGHPHVRVLDGGLAAWTAAGQPLSRDAPDPPAGDFAAVPGGMPLLDAAGAAELARTGVLLDARAPERFRGEVEPIDSVAGHIPGAHNAPATDNLAPDGRFLDVVTLRARLADAGVRPEAAMGAYCGSGVTAAQLILALELAGYRAALYAGSWSNWITDPERPVATDRIAGSPPGLT